MAYPSTLDNIAADKTDATVSATDHPAHHDALATAVNAIEAELGTNPKGAAADVKARIAAAEAGVTAEASARANADALLAPLASPALTGTPTVPTAAQGTNTTQAASTAYVQTETGLLIPKSLVDAKGDLLVGTANDAVVRKAVGADGLPLVADASQGDGLSWAQLGLAGLTDTARQAWRPAGSVCENYPRWTATQSFNLVSGRLEMVGGNVVPKGQTVNSVTFVTSSVAAVTPTHSWAILTDGARVVLARSTDRLTAAVASDTAVTFTFPVPYTATDDTIVYCGICVVAATPPSLQSTPGTRGGITSNLPKMEFIGDIGLTDPTSAPSPVANNSVQNNWAWCAIS